MSQYKNYKFFFFFFLYLLLIHSPNKTLFYISTYTGFFLVVFRHDPNTISMNRKVSNVLLYYLLLTANLALEKLQLIPKNILMYLLKVLYEANREKVFKNDNINTRHSCVRILPTPGLSQI